MPREIYVITPRSVTLEDLVAAGIAIDGSLGLRTLFEGAALQLVNADGVAVVTIDNSRLLEATDDAARVTRGLSIPPAGSWWTEAVAPWGSAGAAGVAVVERLALNLGGNFHIEEGL